MKTIKGIPRESLQLDQDPVLDISVWNTTPGRLLVATRLVWVLWFLAILRRRRDATNLAEMIEPLHFAAAYLLWLLTLPMVVFIAHTSVSPLWRHKTIFGGCLRLSSSEKKPNIWQNKFPNK